MSTTTNGRSQRPSLAQQIDRLDLILDNLSEGLHEAVAEAVKVAVTRAVEAALVEVLTNAELRRHLVPEVLVPRRTASETTWTMAARFARSCWQSARLVAGGLWRVAKTLPGRSVAVVQRAGLCLKGRLSKVSRLIWFRGIEAAAFFRQIRRPLLVALGIGLMVSVGCFIAGPVIASAISACVGFAGSLATLLRWSTGARMSPPPLDEYV
jgi:hypothetical protein